jgi:hypothetical protein
LSSISGVSFDTPEIYDEETTATIPGARESNGDGLDLRCAFGGCRWSGFSAEGRKALGGRGETLGGDG